VHAALRLENFPARTFAAQVRHVIDKHPGLRTIFPEGPDGLAAVASQEPEVLQFDYSDREPESAFHAATESAAHLIKARLDTRSGPLYRFVHFRLSATEVMILIVVEHLVCDGESLSLILTDLFANPGTAAALDAAAFVDLMSRMEARREASLAAGLDWWERRLEGGPVFPDVPSALSSGGTRSFTCEQLTSSFARPLAAAIQQAGRSAKCTPTAAGLYFVAEALVRMQGQPKIPAEQLTALITVANRNRLNRGVVSWFANTTLFRLRYEDMKRLGFVAAQRALTEVLMRQDLSLHDLLLRFQPSEYGRPASVATFGLNVTVALPPKRSSPVGVVTIPLPTWSPGLTVSLTGGGLDSLFDPAAVVRSELTRFARVIEATVMEFAPEDQGC
jgi:hypothetical protein